MNTNRFPLTHRFPARKQLGGLIAICLLTIASGCATTANVKQVDRLDAVSDDPTILIFTPDVKYYLLTTGGVPEPHAEWTKTGRENFSDALRQYASERGIKIVSIPQNKLSDTEIAYQKLYSAVGATVLSHHFGPYKLPTKNGAFDWSMGPGVAEIAKLHAADYALFSFYRDYQATGGRVAFAVLAAIAGVGISAGHEYGFASLVDLRSGDIVWFNQVSVGVGELKDKQGARQTIDALFKDLPEG